LRCKSNELSNTFGDCDLIFFLANPMAPVRSKGEFRFHPTIRARLKLPRALPAEPHDNSPPPEHAHIAAELEKSFLHGWRLRIKHKPQSADTSDSVENQEVHAITLLIQKACASAAAGSATELIIEDVPASLAHPITAALHLLECEFQVSNHPAMAGVALSPRGNAEIERLQLLVLGQGKLRPVTRRNQGITKESSPKEHENAPVSKTKSDRGIIDIFLHMGFASLVTSIIGLAIKLTLPRMLGPDQMGHLYFAESMALMFFGLMPLGIASYISREVPKNPMRAHSILATVIPVQALLAILITLALLGFLIVSGSDSVTLRCALAMAVFAATTSFNRSIIGRIYLSLDKPAVVARIEIIARIALVALLALAFLSTLSATSVAWCYGISAAIGLALMLSAAKRDGLLAIRWDSKDLKEIVVSSLPFFAVAALIEIYGNIDTAMLKYISNNSEVAYYGSANKLKGAALVLLPIIQAALQPALSRSWSQDQRLFAEMVSNGMRILVAVSLPMVIAFMTLPDALSSWIFGAEFAPSYLAIACLAPILTLTSLNVLMGACLNIIGNGVSFLVVVLLSLLANVCLNWVSINFAMEHFGPGSGAAAAALATVASELLVLLAMRQIFKFGLNFSELIKFLALAFLPCIFIAGAFQQIISLSPWLRILIITPAVPLYLFVTGIVRAEDIQWFLRTRFSKERRRNPGTY
jgi:O-antigen/teichoic acid export membrane protein